MGCNTNLWVQSACCMNCHVIHRLDDALSDCIWAKKHMRDNTVIDYRQLGLPHKLFSWQVCLCLPACFLCWSVFSLPVSCILLYSPYFLSTHVYDLRKQTHKHIQQMHTHTIYIPSTYKYPNVFGQRCPPLRLSLGTRGSESRFHMLVQLRGTKRLNEEMSCKTALS